MVIFVATKVYVSIVN